MFENDFHSNLEKGNLQQQKKTFSIRKFIDFQTSLIQIRICLNSKIICFENKHLPEFGTFFSILGKGGFYISE